jgi:hypothetical protein
MGVQQRRQAGRVLRGEPLVGSHRTRTHVLLDEAGQCRAHAGDLAQVSGSGQCFERLGVFGNGAGRAAVGADAVALLAGHLQAECDLLEEPRDGQVAGARRVRLAQETARVSDIRLAEV